MDAFDAQPGLVIQGFTYAERPTFLLDLDRAIDAAGGWVLDKRLTSAVSLDLLLEVQDCALPDVYAALLASGLELSRDAHRAIAERCNCSMHLLPNLFFSSILSMHIEIHFLTDPARLDLTRLTPFGSVA